MNPETIAQLLALLKELKAEPLTEEHKQAGICSFLDLEMYRRHKVYMDHGWNYGFNKEWEHFSGWLVYPIPDPEDLQSPSGVYHDTQNYWDGEYGALRWKLVDHYIQCLEQLNVTPRDAVVKAS